MTDEIDFTSLQFKKLVCTKIVKCDVCKKMIRKSVPYLDDNNYLKYKDENHEPYFHIVKGHNDWGNDSCDSVESLDACSDECLASIVCDYIENYSKEWSTAYIEIEKER